MSKSVMRSGLISLVGLACSAPALAQTVEGFGVSKTQYSRQTSGALVELLPAAELPYGFDTSVFGDDLGGIVPPVVVGQFSNPEPGHNLGILGWDAEDDEWRYGWPNFNGWGTETLGELDSLFGSGGYTFNLLNTSTTLHLTGDIYPSTTPLLTLTGGAWSDGVYVIDPDSELVITTSVYAEYGTHIEDAIFIDIFGFGFNDDINKFGTIDPEPTLSLTVPAGSMLDGEYYTVESGFIAGSDFKTDMPAFPGAFAFAGYERITELMVRVDANPGCNAADNAAPFGLLDLADIIGFVTAFGALEQAADIAEPFGVYDLADVLEFVTVFSAGCP